MMNLKNPSTFIVLILIAMASYLITAQLTEHAMNVYIAIIAILLALGYCAAFYHLWRSK